MKTNVEETDALHRTISIELPWDMIADELDREYKDLSGKVNIKGFRKGKVPRTVLKQRFAAKVNADVTGRLIQEAYEAALIQNKIMPVAMPDVEQGEFKEGESYSFVAKVEIQPEVELKKTDGFEVTLEEVEITDQMIKEETDRLLDSRAVLVPIEDRQEAQKDDVAIIDYKAKADGEPIEGGEKEDHEVQLGSGQTVPGFEDNVLGMTIGEDKDFDLTFPTEDFPEALAGKKATFSVKLKALKARDIPKLDDEFAQDLGEDGVKTAADVTEMVTRRLREGMEAAKKKEARTKLLDQLIEANSFPVPPSMVERQKEGMLMEVQTMLQWQGLNPDQIAERKDKILEDLGPRAEREVGLALILEAIAKRDDVTVSEADIDAHLENVAKRSGQNLPQLKALYSDPNRIEELKLNLRHEKVVDSLLEKSNMNKVPAAGDDSDKKEESTEAE